MMFEAYVTNLGMYPEYGVEVGEYLKFPTTAEEVRALFSRIGIDGMVLPINYLLQLNLEYSLQRELCRLSYLWSFSAKHTSSPFCYVCFTV